MQRRAFLKVAGSSGVIVAASAAGLGVFFSTRTPHAALKPWQFPGSEYADPMRQALSYAILAPNPHNRQPWVVDLKSDTEAVLTCDLKRLLPATDPFSRQIVIGLGAFLELFAQAASHNKHLAQITLFPEGQMDDHRDDRLDARPIAHLKLIQDQNLNNDPLFSEVLHRHTNRQAYDTTQIISEEVLRSITSVSSSEVNTAGLADGPLLQELRNLTHDALRDEILDPTAFRESIDLMRIGRSEIESNPDGISLGGGFLETLNLVGILNRESLADPDSSSFQVGLDMAKEQAMTAMGFVWITTPGNSRREQIAAGRNYLRVALQVSRLGLAMQPMSQALQEYRAMQPHYRKIHQMLTPDNPQRIQMLARLGYADAVAPAPRWALSTRVKHG